MELKETSKRKFRIFTKKIIIEELEIGKENSTFKGKASFVNNESICGDFVIEDSNMASFDNLGDKLVNTEKAPTFSKLVKDYMRVKNITTKDIYRNSLINRKLFSALNVNDYYIPSKETAIMYCFALNLNYNESLELLSSAGYTLYKYSNFDIIIKYFLEHRIYNIDKLNDTLYSYTKRCIGY